MAATKCCAWCGMSKGALRAMPYVCTQARNAGVDLVPAKTNVWLHPACARRVESATNVAVLRAAR